ncbi:MAG: PD-(D/E)XK nuclease family protein, partial [Clostridia bacterium]|nr:PD-(D/E)XK nuclease family protein [Clostridia bacterium]
ATLYREREFLCRLKAKEILETEAEDFVLLQGAIDLLAVGDFGVKIIDYKYSHKTDEQLIKTYTPQLNLYKKVTSAILHCSPDKNKHHYCKHSHPKTDKFRLNLHGAGQTDKFNRYICRKRRLHVMIKRKHFIAKIISLLAVVLMFCSLCTLTACTTYDSFWEEDESILFGYSEYKNEAYIGEYFWRGHIGEDMDIVIPNTSKGAPLTALGGYYGIGVPTPFEIHFVGTDDLKKELFGDVQGRWSSDEITGNTQEEVHTDVKAELERYYEITNDFEIQDVVFNLHIGSNLQRIELISSTHVSDMIKEITFLMNDDESEVLSVRAFSFVITVDEENEYFYSDDLGRMYYKENNNLVDCFLYHNRETFPENSLPY